MSGLTRQEMKRDEVQEQILVGVEWFQEHWRKIVAAVVAVLVAITAFFAFRLVRESRSEDAQAALGEALRYASAPVVDADPTPDDAANPTFATEDERDQRAETALQQVVDDFGSSEAADVARMVLAQMAADSGDTARAREIWQEAARDEGTAIGVSARLNLISLDRQERPAELADELQAMVDDGDSALPSDVLLFELGQTLEVAGDVDEASAVYQRLIDEFPASPFVVQARERVQS